MSERAPATAAASRPTVLVVDDDAKVVATIVRYLEHGGMSAVTASTGLEALARARALRPDLVILDRMLPELDGLSVCRILREESSVPIIMLTARAAEHERLEGLDFGADDYVVKPFSPRELVARVRAVLRRGSGGGPPEPNAAIQLGALTVDAAHHHVRLRGESIALTATELRLLAILARAPGRVFSRAELMEQLFGWDYEGTERGVDAHIKNLRRKIERDVARPKIIETVIGVGYRLSRAGIDASHAPAR
ncbi:MAG TPA: response regulator transcription factor [Gemmatimonadaceae bacterium]|nr:response regulator transcription factor [Gemmatimonadaceae bacterium]